MEMCIGMFVHVSVSVYMHSCMHICTQLDMTKNMNVHACQHAHIMCVHVLYVFKTMYGAVRIPFDGRNRRI